MMCTFVHNFKEIGQLFYFRSEPKTKQTKTRSKQKLFIILKKKTKYNVIKPNTTVITSNILISMKKKNTCST